MGILLYEAILYIILSILLFIYLKLSHHFHWFDQPNESRKLHTKEKPTSAGLIFMLPMLLIYLLIPSFFEVNGMKVGVGLLVLYTIGGIDDFFHVSVKIRLFLIILVSGFSIYLYFKDSNLIPLYILFFYTVGLVWWLNLYNFMDGADGMAVLHALVTSTGYFVILTTLGDFSSNQIIYISVFMICLFAFLLFNFPQSKMFMGDSGSLSVAFVIAGVALYGISNNIFDDLVVISFHLVFIVDATMTLLTRLKYGHKISQAHNLHLFQSLIKNGMTHAKVSILYAVLTLLLIVITCFLVSYQIERSLRLLVLMIETVILVFLWFNFYNKTKFKRFIQ